MTQKIVISKPTFDAKTETDPNNLIFSSDYDSLKYYVSGYVDIDMSGAGSTETYVTHDLGYIPFFIAFMNYIPLETDYSHAPFYTASFGNWKTLDVYATTTRLYFTVKKSGSSAITWRIVYKIFRNNMGI